MVTVRPTGEVLGAFVEGVDLTKALDDGVRSELQAALDERLVLLFRNGDRTPTDAQVVDFCASFGPCRPSLADRSRVVGHPEINLVANRDVGPVQGTGGSGALEYHSDLHMQPPLIEFIYLDSLAVPSTGGITWWLNLCSAYDALSDVDKERLSNLVVRYGMRTDLDFDHYFKTSDKASAAMRDHTDVALVQRNPRTGRTSVWPNTGPNSNHTAQVLGMSPEDSASLLRDLYDHCTQEQFRWGHAWQVGDSCLWLNTQTMHGRDPFPEDEVRIMRHVNILGLTDVHQAA
jgi:taurine dioxygenase